MLLRDNADDLPVSRYENIVEEDIDKVLEIRPEDHVHRCLKG